MILKRADDSIFRPPEIVHFQAGPKLTYSITDCNLQYGICYIAFIFVHCIVSHCGSIRLNWILLHDIVLSVCSVIAQFFDPVKINACNLRLAILIQSIIQSPT